MSVDALLAGLRHEARSVPESGIVEAVNYGRTREGLIPLWAGEGDLPTPGFICDAATRSLAAGETFYTWQRGIPDLRQALAGYHSDLFGKAFEADQFFVTGSGMQAIQLCLQAIAGAGDELIVPMPAWPNFAAAAQILGARSVPVLMRHGNNGWQLDLDELLSAATAKTRALYLNSPNNPTGWTATRDELASILAFCRTRGIWIIADEVYAQFYWRGDAPRAPSFYDVMEDDDRILFVNTFSKNWAMTGWRMGWIGAHPALGQLFENLVQYSTSGVAGFMQRAGVAALTQGRDFLRFQIERAKTGRAIVCDALSASSRLRFSPPDGAFYAFFAVDGFENSRTAALQLIDEANIGLAPGMAFNEGGEAFLRICFARSDNQLEEAMARLTAWLR